MASAMTAEKPRRPIKSERNRAAAAGRSTFAGPASSTSSAFHKKRAQGRSNHGEASSSPHERNANGDNSNGSSDVIRHPRKNSDIDVPSQVKDVKGDSHDDDEDDDDDDEDDEEDVRSKTSLSLSGHQLPPLAALVDTLAQFSFLQRLDLSSIEPSDASPKGLDTLTWLAKAVFRSNTSAKCKGRAFGDHLTWLNLSSNPNLTSESCIGLEALEELCVLTLSHCALTTVPPSVTPLRNLKALVLNNNSISNIPDSFPHLPELNSLILSHNEITTLPASLPASLPALKKLSLGHNKLKGSESLPDFSLCLSLREVRLNDNPEIKILPSHVRNWGKGADGKTAPGLELLELKDCGLDTWDALSTLVEAEDEKESQPRLRRKGLTQLLLKGNGVAMEERYKERILEVHPTLRVLDNERLQPRVRREDREVDDSDANGKKKKTKTPSKPERRGRDVVEEHSADEESDDDEAAQMAEEMRALRRGKPEPKSNPKKGRKPNRDGDDSDDVDDDEGAQLAAEMRALRRGQATPRNPPAGKDSSLSKSKSKQQDKPLEASEDTDRAKPKHKRGTRSGKKVNKTESTADKSTTADRADRGFFEAVDAAEEKARLAPIYELSKKRAKIASGRTQVAEGVLEDATSSLSKARQKESKGRTELDTFDDTAPEPAKSAPSKAQAKKPKQKAEDKVEDRKVNTSVVGIVDLRKQAKSHKGTDQKRKISEKEAEGALKKKPRTSMPFIGAANGAGEGDKTASSEAIGSGADAWGAGGAWS